MILNRVYHLSPVGLSTLLAYKMKLPNLTIGVSSPRLRKAPYGTFLRRERNPSRRRQSLWRRTAEAKPLRLPSRLCARGIREGG